MEWIKVEDQMPEKESLLIGYQNCMIIGYVGLDKDKGEYYGENDNEQLDHVTHWMPLPSPPEK
jgi:hypothetical protein